HGAHVGKEFVQHRQRAARKRGRSGRPPIGNRFDVQSPGGQRVAYSVRRSGIDFTYRVPGVRNWLTLYGDGFTDDEVSPLFGAWDKSAWSAGIYLPRVPGISKLDFRAEGMYTDPPIGGTVSHGFFYFNGRYLSGYTADRNLMGSWIGRQGQGGEGWATYWFTPQNKLQFNF